MSDVSYYRCPECGEEISGETVGDPNFGIRMDVHKARHDEANIDRMEPSTLIAALTLYALSAADPSIPIVLLERLGVVGAEDHIIDGRARVETRMRDAKFEVRSVPS